jgi:5-methyltetrahydrofolate--homocysteine methyltransferase
MTVQVRKYFETICSKQIFISDGGIGTQLQACGLKPGELPETMLLHQPEKVGNIHRNYYRAGARMITTNTFSATRVKLNEFGLGDKLEEINSRAVTVARRSVGDDAIIAGSMGPAGILLRPMGTARMADLEALYVEQALALKKASVDLAIIETIGDVGEFIAAARACHHVGLPMILSMTFNDKNRSLSGSPPSVAVAVSEPFKPLAVGTNCGMGPAGMIGVVQKFCAVTHLPVIAQPNAGLPNYIDGKTVFQMDPVEFAEKAVCLAEAGAGIIGGCCGTTPDHIAMASQTLKSIKPQKRIAGTGVKFASRTKVFVFGDGYPFGIIGERINPTGRKKLSAQLKNFQFALARRDAVRQSEAGAHLLDLNVGVPDIDEVALMERIVEEIQDLVPDVALSIDSTDADALEAGIRTVSGRPLLNSINGEETKLETLLPLVLATGSNFIALAMDERGIPRNDEERIQIIRRIIDQAQKMGIDRTRILVDCLVFTVGSQPEQPGETLKAVKRVRDEFGCATVLGVSNVSFGLPRREIIASAFLAMAHGKGLSAGIINPLSGKMMQTIRAAELLVNRDPGAQAYLACIEKLKKEELEHSKRTVKQKTVGKENNVAKDDADTGNSQKETDRLNRAVFDGDKSGIKTLLIEELDSGRQPEEILRFSLLPAIQEVGKKYDCGELYLPQLILAGETMRIAVDHLRPQLLESQTSALHATPFILGTVAGDNHDIGKNIVGIVLENHGFTVIDLGKNVSTDHFLESARNNKCHLIGLSALMTTTLPAMEETVSVLKEKDSSLKIIVGGAVVTRDFAKRIGADGYSKEAVGAGPLAMTLAGLNPSNT